jgi:L,D-transpeptidase ErfK/SrfK
MKIPFPLFWNNHKRSITLSAGILVGSGLVLFGLAAAVGMLPGGWPFRSQDEPLAAPSDQATPPAGGEPLLMRKMAALAPRGIYIVIDTGQNLLLVKSGEKILHQAVVSTGSGKILQDPASERKWVFDTPRGVFSVKNKIKNPYWVKPDWAFIEKGEPIPQSAKDRVESGGLGAYALGIGNGYFIHGTLYTRLLGKNVTHGCVRVADKDLQYVYETVPPGAKVIIF